MLTVSCPPLRHSHVSRFSLAILPFRRRYPAKIRQRIVAVGLYSNIIVRGFGSGAGGGGVGRFSNWRNSPSRVASFASAAVLVSSMVMCRLSHILVMYHANRAAIAAVIRDIGHFVASTDQCQYRAIARPIPKCLASRHATTARRRTFHRDRPKLFLFLVATLHKDITRRFAAKTAVRYY